MTDWKRTTEKPETGRRRKVWLIVCNPGCQGGVYDAKTGLIDNVLLTEFEWWIFAPPVSKLNIQDPEGGETETLDVKQYMAYLEKMAQAAEDETANMLANSSRIVSLAKAAGILMALKVLEDGSYKWPEN